MSGFTPGPWKQDTFYEGADWLNEMIGSDGTHVVCFGHDYDDVGMFGWPKNMPSSNEFAAQKAVAAANAHLVAAAPELYEALEACVPLLVDEYEGSRGLISPGREAIEAARAALANARGEPEGQGGETGG